MVLNGFAWRSSKSIVLRPKSNKIRQQKKSTENIAFSRAWCCLVNSLNRINPFVGWPISLALDPRWSHMEEIQKCKDYIASGQAAAGNTASSGRRVQITKLEKEAEEEAEELKALQEDIGSRAQEHCIF